MKNSLKKIALAALPTMALFSTVITYSTELKETIPDEYITSIRSVNSFRQSGKISFGGLEGNAEIIFQSPDKTVTKYDLGEFKFSQIYDGHTAWMRDQNDQVVELTGNERQKVINTAYMAGFSYLLDDRMPGKVVFAGDTLLAEKKYCFFIAYPDGGDSIKLLVNPVNGRLEMTEEYIDEVLVRTYQKDFRLINGIEFPFLYQSESTIPQLNSTLEIADVQLNVPIPDSVFQTGAVSKVDFQFIGNLDSVVVPIKFVNGHIFVRVHVNSSKEAYFILDSGAGSNIIDKTFAGQLGLTVSGEVASKGVAGYETAALTHVDSIVVGQVALLDQTAAIADLSALNITLPEKPAGLLGYDFISRFPIRINYSTSTLVMFNPAIFDSPDSALAIDLDFMMKIPVISAKIDSIKGRFLVDLGNSLGLILHKPFSDKHNLEAGFSDIKEMKRTIGGIGGMTEAYAATGKTFQMGNCTIDNPPLLIAGGDAGAIRSSNVDGNIGNLMLMKFDLLLDYNARKLYLFPRRADMK